jgi:hypothetical protein
MVDLIYHKKQKKISIAQSWDEITAEQYINIVKLLHAGITDEDMALDKALYILAGRSLFSFLRIPLDIRMRCYDHILWIFKKQEITKQFLPFYSGLYGPESEFNNLSMAEFHHSEMAYYRLTHEEDEDEMADALNELVAILYRGGKPMPYDKNRNSEGDMRIPFLFGDIDWHKKKVKRWPMHVKQSILLWYDGCRQLLITEYPTAFKGDKADDGYFDGMYGMLRSIASDGKHGNFEKVEQMLVHNAFREIVESIEEAKELERQMKSHGV